MSTLEVNASITACLDCLSHSGAPHLLLARRRVLRDHKFPGRVQWERYVVRSDEKCAGIVPIRSFF